jgi:hypothetical protein
MLIPLTRQKFEELIPLTATGDQYRYSWGNLSDLLRRVLISVTGIVAALVLRAFLGDWFDVFALVIGIGAGFYWFWSPVFVASRRNFDSRRYQYCGFWQGEVLDIFITEELVGTEEKTNKRGELVVVENRERCLNLEVGDESGFSTQLQVPLKRDHRAIRPGDIAEMIVMSQRADLGRIAKVSDIYLPEYNLWVSDYPYLRRDIFLDISRKLGQ